MKKRYLISILMAFLLTVLLILPVFAASATATVSSVSANRKDSVTLTVTLAKAVTVGSGGIEVFYDTNVLELVKGEWNVSNVMLSTFTGNKGAFAYTVGTEISGKVFTATFKVKDNAAFGDSTVKMTLQLKDGANADISVTNNSGKVTVTCKHSYSVWGSADGTNHTRTCSICGNKENAKHAFTNACDTKCDTCGYTRTITHSYKNTWSSNTSQHWHECSVCNDKKDAASHTPGPVATESTPQICTACGYVIKSALGHTHISKNDWSSDESTHWNDCETCDSRTNESAHSYDSDCDTNCNTCARVRQVTHSYDNSCDVECNICGGNRNVTHEFEELWDNNAEGHWHECSICSEQSKQEAHEWGKGIIIKEPSKTEAGQKNYVCVLCNYTKIVELELSEKEGSGSVDYESDSEKNNQLNVDDQTHTKQTESGVHLVSLLVGVVIGLAVGIGALLVLTGKKR